MVQGDTIDGHDLYKHSYASAKGSCINTANCSSGTLGSLVGTQQIQTYKDYIINMEQTLHQQYLFKNSSLTSFKENMKLMKTNSLP